MLGIRLQASCLAFSFAPVMWEDIGAGELCGLCTGGWFHPNCTFRSFVWQSISDGRSDHKLLRHGRWIGTCSRDLFYLASLLNTGMQSRIFDEGLSLVAAPRKDAFHTMRFCGELVQQAPLVLGLLCP